jgi:hypothetical protein
MVLQAVAGMLGDSAHLAGEASPPNQQSASCGLTGPYERHELAQRQYKSLVNPLTPNDPYSGRTAPLTSKVAFYIFIQHI